MKTIEERAKVSIPDAVNPDEVLPAREAFIVGQQRIAYILGAREQKAIDDAEWLKIKASWEREAQINHNDEANYQQGFHDAVEMAFKWLKARNVLTDASLIGFRQAMRNGYEKDMC